MLEGSKVISATQMRLIEEHAISKGASALHFMERAAEQIAAHVERFITQHKRQKSVTLLVGKGNNGGDAYCAGVHLLRKHYHVKAYTVASVSESSVLCQQMHDRFVQEGGVVDLFSHRKGMFSQCQGVLVDGLLGTGFRGKVQEPLLAMIAQANGSKCPIIAIDVPSGLNADTGEVETVAIKAQETLCLGAIKVGFFLNRGLDYVGKISHLDFGLPPFALDAAQAAGYLLSEEHIGDCLPPMRATRHKYQAGYVLAVAGSSGMSGAAILSCSAALRSGAGMVRLFYAPGMEMHLGAIPSEILSCRLEPTEMEKLKDEEKRAKALLIGPGLGRDKCAELLVKKVLRSTTLPCVIDADALFFLGKHPSWHPPRGAILTPHRGEAALLIPDLPVNYTHALQEYAQQHHVTVVLKGAPTWIFHPGMPPLICHQGDPGMATAGCGDVLTGLIASLLSQGLLPRDAAALGVYLHGLAGECAAASLTSYCMTASDVIAHFPDAFRHLCFTKEKG